MNINNLTAKGKDKLESAGIGEALIDARILLSRALGKERSYLYSHGDEEVPGDREAVYLDTINKRAQRIPLQHITGEQDFMGLTFKVNKTVLIPRQDTEILVEEALKELHDGMDILDLCTGSGCILLSLLNYSNDCSGVGVDISRDALEIARENALNLGLSACDFILGDILSCAFNLDPGFDMICSNPPYIPTGELSSLMPEVRDHDPVIALDGGDDGLLFYREIARIAGKCLKSGGSLFLEIGHDQGDGVKAILEKAGFRYIEIIKDYGQNDRVVKCIK